LVGSKGLEPL